MERRSRRGDKGKEWRVKEEGDRTEGGSREGVERKE
jgi:hypothetical protein